MKKRKISRDFTDRTPERPSEIGTSQSHISNDPIISMEMDEMEISYDSEDEQYDSRDKQKFNFLTTKTNKSKRKFNIDPFVLIEHLLSNHEDDNQEVEDDDVASIDIGKFFRAQICGKQQFCKICADFLGIFCGDL